MLYLLTHYTLPRLNVGYGALDGADTLEEASDYRMLANLAGESLSLASLVTECNDRVYANGAARGNVAR